MNIEFSGYLELELDVCFDTDEDGPQITDVLLVGRDILGLLTEGQIEQLVGQARDAEQAAAERKQDMLEARGDWLYEQHRDYALEQATTAQSLQNDPDGRYK